MFTHSFDEYDSHRPRFSIGGTVSGLEGEHVVIVLDGVAHEVTDGDFTHPATIVDGDVYKVDVEAQPPTHSCVVERGRGIVRHAHVTDVRVVCASSVATLDSLTITGSVLNPSFAPRTFEYRAQFDGVVNAMRGRVIAIPTHRGAQVFVAGAPVGNGSPRRPFVVEAAPSTVDIDVVAPDGKGRRTYRVHVAAPPARHRFLENDARAGFGDVVAVGADLLAASHDGVVRTYARTNGSWAREAVLAPDDGVGVTELGRALAICSDMLIVGSPQERDDTGAVYVFRRSSAGWQQEARLSSPPGGGRFGESVACHGDLLIVGAPCAATPTFCTDRAVLYEGTSGHWSPLAVFEEPTAFNARMGSAVAIDDETVAIAADHHGYVATTFNSETRMVAAGAVFVYRRIANAGWAKEAHLYASNPRLQARFGKALALRGNVLVAGSDDPSAGRGIGASRDDTSAVRAGAVYVFTRDGAKWTEGAFVKSPDTIAEGQFGSSIAITEGAITVGAPGEGSGALHFFTLDGTGWRFTGHLRAATDAHIGGAVAVHGIDLIVGNVSGSGAVDAY